MDFFVRSNRINGTLFFHDFLQNILDGKSADKITLERHLNFLRVLRGLRLCYDAQQIMQQGEFFVSVGHDEKSKAVDSVVKMLSSGNDEQIEIRRIANAVFSLCQLMEMEA